MILTRLAYPLALGLAISTVPSHASGGGESGTARTEIAAAAVAPMPNSGPALWKLSDDDTTIYLFGTVHALPEGKGWYSSTIEKALAASGTLVTEIPQDKLDCTCAANLFQKRALLPEGMSLRAYLSGEQAATYDSALKKIGFPPSAFDNFKPWFAEMMLSTLPLMQSGFSREEGVERVLNREAGPAKARDALETMEYQIAMFDDMSLPAQVAMLVATASQIAGASERVDDVVTAWMAGDPEKLAQQMTDDLDADEAMAERLLYARNRNWAQWISGRMVKPGTVFIAVGAAHLAGPRSVIDYLARGGLKVARVQ